MKKTNVSDFMKAKMDITKWMGQAGQPFLGYLSKGVIDNYINPLLKLNKESELNDRIYDIAWMSSGCPIRDARQVQTDKILKFPYGVSIGGVEVNLCKVYNSADFEGGYTACLIMLPEEAASFDPTWHVPV